MLCLGLGIGVNTSIFGVVSAVMLRPLPVAVPERLVWISRSDRTPWSYRAYRDVRDRSRTFSGLAVSIPMESDLDVQGDARFVVAEAVTGNYADVLGVQPVLGHWTADDREAAAVISYAVWEERFDRDPNVVGRIVRSQDESYTIVGVAPREYLGVFVPLRTDVWVPIESRARLAEQLEQGSLQGMMKLLGRLREGVSATQASAELNAIDLQLSAGQVHPPVTSPIVAEQVQAIPDAGLRRRARAFTILLATVVGLVLVIACVNVGHLLLVRGTLRQREFAVRHALGASRRRLLQQLLTESLVLATGGATCGVILAVWANRLLERSLPPFLGAFAFELDARLDWRAVVFAALVALAATVLCGLLPAWRTSRSRNLVAFKGEIGSGAPRRWPLGLVAQVVMSLVLLFVAGSFLQALDRIHTTDTGFEVDGRLYAYTSLPSAQFAPESRRSLYGQLLDRLRALPGVRAVSMTSSLPLMPTGSTCVSRLAGERISVTTSAVDIEYFDTMGVDRLAGRDFAASDISTSMEAVIVDESLARRVWPNGGALGERIVVGCDAPTNAVVVGIVADSAITTSRHRARRRTCTVPSPCRTQQA